MRNELLLITPPYHCGVVEVAGRWLPLNLLYVAAAARKAGVEPALYDAMSLFTGWDEIRQVLRERQPRFVGSYAITATIDICVELGRVVKEEVPECHLHPGRGPSRPSCGRRSSRPPIHPSTSSSAARASRRSTSCCGP